MKNKFFWILIWLPFAVACASYQSKVEGPRRQLQQGNAEEAAKELKSDAEKEGDDQLVYLLDYGVALQQAGQYKESNAAFQKADSLADIKDYHSLSRIAGSILVNEEMVQYKGEEFEKVLINALSAINYAVTNNLDDALVEARRLNEKLYKFKMDAKRDYEQNPFAKYLSAMIWEADGKWDDAFIDYESTFKLAPYFTPIRGDLLRAAKMSQRQDAFEKYQREFPEVKVDSDWKNPALGELVLIFQQGWSPRKYPRPENYRFPKMYPVYSTTRLAQLQIPGFDPVRSNEIFSVRAMSVKTLDDAYAALIARRVGGQVVKYAAANKISEKNQLLGLMAWIGLNLSDRADLRQWSTLPETFQIARKYLPQGQYQVKVVGLREDGGLSGEESKTFDVTIKGRKKTFITWRSFR